MAIAILLNTGTSTISDVVGNDTKGSAFVYGSYSFMDKMSTGFLLWWWVKDYQSSPEALRILLGLIPTFAAVGCLFFTWLGTKLYADKLAKISSGSLLKDRKNKL